MASPRRQTHDATTSEGTGEGRSTCPDRLISVSTEFSIQIPMVGEAPAQATQNPGPVHHYAQEDASGIGGVLATSDPAADLPSVQALNHELHSGTLCGHKVVFLWFFKLL